MTSAQVTIILPVFNGEATLVRAVESILHQTYPHWKLLVIDDGSTDSTLKLAHSFQDPRITVISDGTRKGIVARLNQGVELVTTPYIARMDADDYSLPERLERQLQFLENNSNINLLGTAIRLVTPDGTTIGKRIFSASHSGIISRPWLKTISIAHPTWCGRTEWFRQWPYHHFFRNEDQELLLRASSSSTYSNLQEPLLEYTIKRNIYQNFQTRLSWLTILVKYYLKRRNYIKLFLGISVFFVKISIDFIHSLIQKLPILKSPKI